ncbi:MAG TPA: PfkB family carbohydrate kinase [Solirubrobacteraceae bacterium]
MTHAAIVGHIEWVDFVPVARLPRPGEVIHAHGAFSRAAGGGGVAAGVLAELGAQVDFYTALGDDTHGRAAVEQLHDRGVRMHVAWRQEPTRRAVTLLQDGGERAIITIGKRLDPLGTDDLDWDGLRAADGVYVTAGDAEALRRARAAPVVVASPRARTALLSAGSQLDAMVFSSHDRDERDWAQLSADRARLLVSTEGGAGGRWWGASEGRWNAVPPPGAVMDSYGCGDSFAAGFTYGLATGPSVAHAAELGARCGARCLTRRGAP